MIFGSISIPLGTRNTQWRCSPKHVWSVCSIDAIKGKPSFCYCTFDSCGETRNQFPEFRSHNASIIWCYIKCPELMGLFVFFDLFFNPSVLFKCKFPVVIQRCFWWLPMYPIIVFLCMVSSPIGLIEYLDICYSWSSLTIRSNILSSFTNSVMRSNTDMRPNTDQSDFSLTQSWVFGINLKTHIVYIWFTSLSTYFPVFWRSNHRECMFFTTIKMIWSLHMESIQILWRIVEPLLFRSRFGFVVG